VTKAFIIPGYRETSDNAGYKEIASMFRKKGCDPVIVTIDWKNKTMAEYVDQFRTILSKTDEPFYLFGFSFGAFIAFLTATERKPKALFLASPSPYFKEDLPSVPAAWKRFIGKNRVKVFSTYSFPVLAKKITCPTYVFLGEKEAKKFPSLEYRAKDAAKRIKNATLTVIPGAKHDASQKEYQDALRAAIDIGIR